MRKPIAYGLTALLGLASLGASQRANPAHEAAQALQYQTKQGNTRIHTKSHPYQVGTASWYGDYFQGKTTASGEPYDMNELTAAHPSLPLGTRIRVTNLRNGRAVILRVNDRGPVVDGRIIDVSYQAAQILGMSGKGIQRVRLDLAPEHRSKSTQEAIQRASISPALERQIEERSRREAQKRAANPDAVTIAMLRQ